MCIIDERWSFFICIAPTWKGLVTRRLEILNTSPPVSYLLIGGKKSSNIYIYKTHSEELIAEGLAWIYETRVNNVLTTPAQLCKLAVLRTSNGTKLITLIDRQSVNPVNTENEGEGGKKGKIASHSILGVEKGERRKPRIGIVTIRIPSS